MQGAKEAVVLGTHFPKIQQTLDLYPNPFSSSLKLNVENPDKIVSIKIFDRIGHSVEAVKNSEIRSSNTLGSSLKPGQYFVQVCGENWMKSFKRLKVIN
jgi:hypothetical protein